MAKKRKKKCDRTLEERDGMTYKSALKIKEKGDKMVCIGKYKGRNRYTLTKYYR
jgi:hypothetical protein